MTPSPGVPDHLTGSELAVLGDTLQGRPDWLDLGQLLERASLSQSSRGLQLVAMAFIYDLVPPGSTERRERVGSPYAPMFDSDDGSYPPRPSDVTEQVRRLWRWVLNAVDDAIVQARLADLLYVAEGPSAHADGRRGAKALLTLASGSEWTALNRAECATRALEIYRELNDRDAVADAARQTAVLVEALLKQEHPGPIFIALRGLTALKPQDRPDGLRALLETVIDRFCGTPHEASALGLAADAAADATARRDLRLRQLNARVEEARRADGLGKVALLQRALEFARAYGFGAEARTLLKELQDIPQSELGLQSVDVSTEIPVDQIRQEVDRICGSGATNTVDALKRLGALVPPPGGSNADVDAEVEREMREFPLSHLFGRTILGPESGAPHFVANTEENKRRAARGRNRKIYAEYLGGVFLGPLLNAVEAHHGRPSHEVLAEHFATDLIGEVRADRVARALELFWEGDHDASAHVLVPRLESILRDIARAQGITVVKYAGEGTFGGSISLNTVMAKLRELNPDVPWLDYLEALLCDPLSINLRNLIAHGLVGGVGATGAGLLLHAACYLALLGEGPTADSGTPDRPPAG